MDPPYQHQGHFSLTLSQDWNHSFSEANDQQQIFFGLERERFQFSPKLSDRMRQNREQIFELRIMLKLRSGLPFLFCWARGMWSSLHIDSFLCYYTLISIVARGFAVEGNFYWNCLESTIPIPAIYNWFKKKKIWCIKRYLASHWFNTKIWIFFIFLVGTI